MSFFFFSSINFFIRLPVTYGTLCNFPHHYCLHNHLVPNKRWPLIGICRCHISAGNRRSNVIWRLHTVSGTDSAPPLNYTNDPVRRCHPYNLHANYRIHIRANIRHYRNGMFQLDSCRLNKKKKQKKISIEVEFIGDFVWLTNLPVNVELQPSSSSPFGHCLRPSQRAARDTHFPLSPHLNDPAGHSTV